MSRDDRSELRPGWDDEELDWLDDLMADREAKTAPAQPIRETPRRMEPVRETPRQETPRRTEPVREAPRQETPKRPEPVREAPRQETPRRPAPIDFEKEPAEEDRAAAPRRGERAVPVREERPSDGKRPAYRRRRRAVTPLTVVTVLLVLGMIFAGWQLGKIFFNYHKDRTAYNDLIENAVTARPVSTAPVTENEEAALPVEVSEAPIEVDWNMLRAINSDIVGWLYCPGTIINYPVVQASDNEFYLDHGFDRASNTSGTLFVDMDSALGVVQSNYIIYGHNMKDNSMFGTFKDYMDEKYADENPSMYYLTPNVNYRVDLFGIHVVEGTIDNYPVFFGDTTAYQSYIDGISTGFYWFKRDIQTTQYQLMTLSTCTSAQGYSDARLVLHGVMVPIR